MDTSRDAQVQAVAASRNRPGAASTTTSSPSPSRSAGTTRRPHSASPGRQWRSTWTSWPRKACSTCYERRTGRTGPGAGRPAKLYHRSDREIDLTLPERQYAVAGRLLAGALEDAEATGGSPRDAVNRRAHEYGESLGQHRERNSLTQVLAAHGFEPRPDRDGIALANCPFQRIAKTTRSSSAG